MIKIHLKHYKFIKSTLNVTFPTFPRTITPKIVTTNWNDETTPYVQLNIYPNPENFTPSRMVWMVTFWKSAVALLSFKSTSNNTNVAKKQTQCRHSKSRFSGAVKTLVLKFCPGKSAKISQKTLYMCET